MEARLSRFRAGRAGDGGRAPLAHGLAASSVAWCAACVLPSVHRAAFVREPRPSPTRLDQSSLIRRLALAFRESPRRTPGRPEPARSANARSSRASWPRAAPFRSAGTAFRRRLPAAERRIATLLAPAKRLRSSMSWMRRPRPSRDALPQVQHRLRVADTERAAELVGVEILRNAASCILSPFPAVVRGPAPCRPPEKFAYRTSTFRNCHGSDVSMSSGKKPGRSLSGVQSV